MAIRITADVDTYMNCLGAGMLSVLIQDECNRIINDKKQSMVERNLKFEELSPHFTTYKLAAEMHWKMVPVTERLHAMIWIDTNLDANMGGR